LERGVLPFVWAGNDSGDWMSKGIRLREDLGAEDLRQVAGKVKDANQVRRLLALAAVYDGKDRAEAARIGAMDRQTLRDWALRLNKDGPNGLIDIKRPGRPPKLSVEQKQELKHIVEAGPDKEKDGVVRWRCVDLRRIIKERFEVDVDEVTIGRVLKELGFAHISARPQHRDQDKEVIASFKKTSLRRPLRR
jgi:transposase